VAQQVDVTVGPGLPAEGLDHHDARIFPAGEPYLSRFFCWLMQ